MATGREVLYVWKERLLNGEMLDLGDTKFQFTYPAVRGVSVQLQRGSSVKSLISLMAGLMTN